MLVDAVAGLQRGDKTLATLYLQFVEKHRSRRVALDAKKRLVTLRDAPSWEDCKLWPANDYKPTPRKRR